MASAIGQARESVDAGRREAATWFERLDGRHATLERIVTEGETRRVQEFDRLLSALQIVGDDEPRRRAQLRALREDASYELAFTEADPLVSIVIPTYANHRLLVERALPSALAQTHANIEVIVVGDGAPPAAREAVEALDDPRVSFFNLLYRGPYPDDPRRRWLVAGVPPYNDAVRRARGRWIAPLDDDDAFHRDHVEVLLRAARERRDEFIYGLVREYAPDGSVRTLGGFPPQCGHYGLQAAIYHAGLASAFELELADADWGEPYDWGILRRMMRAGVRVSMVDQEVVDYYPSQLWGDSGAHDGGGAARPEWELAEEGMGAARAAEDRSGQGWDVAAVARSYARKWPEFLRAIDGPGPLGVGHEVPDGVAMRRDDPLAQNTVLAFAHVLGRATRHRDHLSILDWGGALGHYYELAKHLVDDDVTFDYHLKELAAVNAEGRRLLPEVTFHDTDADALARPYDLVMASGALQYAEDWAEMARRMAAVARPWLYLTRLPVARRHPSFAIRQRAYAFGYETEYVGWVPNRDELVATVVDAGFEMLREFSLLEPMPVARAPEHPAHIGVLFRRREEG